MGEVSSPVSVVQSNFPVVGATLASEPSAAYVPGGGPQTNCATSGVSCGRWVAVGNDLDNLNNSTNNCTAGWTWMYSTDGNANSWTFNEQQTGTDFGCPGGACPGTPSPFGDGGQFTGVWFDHSVAAVTDLNWSPGNSAWKSAVVGVSLATTTTRGGTNQNSCKLGKYSDSIVMLSLDGGQTWGNGSQSVGGSMQWLDTGQNGDAGSNGPPPTGDDMPFVFSNPESPYDTWASWQVSRTGYLRRIQYNLNSSPPTFTSSNPSIAIPLSNADNQQNCGTAGTSQCGPARFNFGFTTLPSPQCMSASELIVVSWATFNGTMQCKNNASGYGITGNPGMDMGLVSWNFAIYDTGTFNGHGPGYWLSDNGSYCQQGNCTGCGGGHCAWNGTSSSHFDACVGRNTNPTACGRLSGDTTPCPWFQNSPDAHIAVDPHPPTSSSIMAWISHTTWTGNSSSDNLPLMQVKLDKLGQLGCDSNGNPSFPPTSISGQQWPPPNPTIDEQFLPAVAMNRNTVNGQPNQRVATYWYSTIDGSDSQVAVYGNSFDNGQWAGAQPITFANQPLIPPGETSWSITAPPPNGQWSPGDYQTMATSWNSNANSNFTFLSLWARDQRANLLAEAWNGGFETGEWTGYGLPGTGWTPGGISAGLVNSPCNSGSWCARVGSTSEVNGNSSIQQQFTAPMTGQAMNISFYYKMVSNDCSIAPNGYPYDWLEANLFDVTTNTPVGEFFSDPAGKHCEPNQAGFKPTPTALPIAACNCTSNCQPGQTLCHTYQIPSPTTTTAAHPRV